MNMQHQKNERSRCSPLQERHPIEKMKFPYPHSASLSADDVHKEELDLPKVD